MEYINCTPHIIQLNDGRAFEPSGIIPRVSSTHSEVVNDECTVTYGEVENLPPQRDGVKLIVSAMVLEAASNRSDLVAPATGHPEVKRENGQIKSVPCFRRR